MIPVDQYSRFQAYLEVRQGRPVNPMSPSRRGIIKDETLNRLCDFIRDSLFEYFSRTQIEKIDPLALQQFYHDYPEHASKLPCFVAARRKRYESGDDVSKMNSLFAPQVLSYDNSPLLLADKARVIRAFPWADVYSSRSERGNGASLFGSITVHGDPKRDWRYVINIYGQLKPGKPSPGRDSAASRLEAFSRALNQIAEMPELKSIGFPYGIGCGLAGGDWNKYGRRLEDFAERVGERGAYVILYRLGQ